MNHNNTITTKRFAQRASLGLSLALLAFAAQLGACPRNPCNSGNEKNEIGA